VSTISLSAKTCEKEWKKANPTPWAHRPASMALCYRTFVLITTATTRPPPAARHHHHPAATAATCGQKQGGLR
jgi:hypothetical protein